MAALWPQWLTDSFLSAKQQLPNDENAYYKPYTRLLYYLFGIEGPFEITPQYYIFRTPGGGMDVVAMFTVELNKHPVFFIEVKPPAHLNFDKQADDQMRERFRDLRPSLITPRLPAISAFGTRFAFYEYDAATAILSPPAIPTNPVFLDNGPPINRWNYDLLDADGIARIRQVVQDVKDMCQALGN